LADFTDKVLAVIPARWASSRFPGKALADISGKPMIRRVWELACRCRTLDKIVVATDDGRIADCVAGFGGEALITPADTPTGTDRVALVARRLPDYGGVLNMQGDEPLLEPEAVDTAVELIFARPTAGCATLVRPARAVAEVNDPNAVKVVMGDRGRVISFSRGQAPFCRDGELLSRIDSGVEHPWRIHIGLYVWRREALLRQVELPVALVEASEGLEQMRSVAAGTEFYAAEISETASIGVDVPEDVAKVEEAILRLGLD
jgi:3-deoxy-manno-octulosonate cytidylyltransferase (CMP-KDO synthetase)